MTEQLLETVARVAEPDEAVSIDELRLAARNSGLPLEALRYDVTPLGMHYLLVHYDIPHVDAGAWTLRVSGAVERELAISLEELRSRERVTTRVTLECAGNGRARLLPRPVSQPWLEEAVGTAEWTGTPLAPLLAEAGLLPSAVDVAFTGHDHGMERGVEQDYARGLSVADATAPELLLAYEMNGVPLPPQHGAPVRLVAPGWYGMASVKWLREITVLEEPFDGFQNTVAYRLKQSADEPGEPVTRIRPRALLQPPGFPDFMTRTRLVDTGRHVLTGRAWSGMAPVSGVEVSTDGGATWAAASLGPSAGRWAWRSWSYEWEAAEPGAAVLCCRATDEAGNVQPVEQPWNRQGMASNLVQRVPVVVRAPQT
ncbi:sulfite oxidase [Motilibacter deserti]|uniref:Sulfite oxidase n=1 Tax=Motilibacter deserti TaxID=2714956 RepID=A0ABX0GTQ1_9ACTN|nr:sulfite oxidase [Motilibacter deserti]NHC14167.1 sulfite oxidase [Motilibacter deserti]